MTLSFVKYVYETLMYIIDRFVTGKVSGQDNELILNAQLVSFSKSSFEPF